MNLDLVNQIANAVLYEGYILYPYRHSAIKNQQRWNFGVLYPRAYAEAQSGHDAWSMQTECIALVTSESRLNVRVRFLHLLRRDVYQPDGGSWRRVDLLETSGDTFRSWEEALEREVSLPSIDFSALEQAPLTTEFSFAAVETREELCAAERTVGLIVRRNQDLQGAITVSIENISGTLRKVRIALANRTQLSAGENSRDQALSRSLMSAHIIVSLENAQWLSLLEPPEEFREFAATCSNVGCWPVLVGDKSERDTMLASPIILYDYPQVAGQSAGDLFDATEIDEILSLRIMTLTDEEKQEMRASDERARLILDRTESMPPEEFLKMHGVLKRVEQ